MHVVSLMQINHLNTGFYAYTYCVYVITSVLMGIASQCGHVLCVSERMRESLHKYDKLKHALRQLRVGDDLYRRPSKKSGFG